MSERVALIAAIMRGLKAYAPDEVEMYGHDEAEMIADYVEPFIQAQLAAAEARERALREALTAVRRQTTYPDIPSPVAVTMRRMIDAALTPPGA